MKTRIGFVSNSSSSSFIVIDYKNEPSKIGLNDFTLVVSPDLGKNQFGWEDERTFDWGSKIIFCYLQTIYAKNKNSKFKLYSDSWLTMLEDVIKEYTGCKKIEWFITTEYDHNSEYSYIDHASSAVEDRNTEMFDNYDSLSRFIFGSNSFIQTDNDNS